VESLVKGICGSGEFCGKQSSKNPVNSKTNFPLENIKRNNIQEQFSQSRVPKFTQFQKALKK
jgi:hypothetical protein